MAVVEEERNVYAERVSVRHAADAHYLLWKHMLGHDAAAQATCHRYGHEARALICERCGQRGVR